MASNGLRCHQLYLRFAAHTYKRDVEGGQEQTPVDALKTADDAIFQRVEGDHR
jgi:hypothetical protein